MLIADYSKLPETAGFALIQDGYALYGVGKSVRAARKMAREWLDHPKDTSDLTVYRATPALIAHVSSNGADRWATIDDVAMTRAEYDHLMADGSDYWVQA